MTPRYSSRLATHLGAIALAMAASQAGATTYSVPLQFTLSLTAPVCSLTVNGVTANAAMPTPAAGAAVNLTPTPLSVLASPNGIVNAIPGTTAFTADAPGIVLGAMAVKRRLNTPPTASVNCTTGTPMRATITKASTASSSVGLSSPYMAGAPGSGQSGTLPVGMAMGIASFAGTTGTSGEDGTTNRTNGTEVVSAIANGSDQPLVLTAAVYANSTTPLTASYAGLWTYSFAVNLDF